MCTMDKKHGRLDWQRVGSRMVAWSGQDVVAEAVEVGCDLYTAWVRSDLGGMRTADPAHPWHQGFDAARRAIAQAV